MLEDTRIIDLVKNGHTDSFSGIVERYQSPVFRYLYRLTGNQETALDLCQDTFIQTYKAILKDEVRVSFSAWLYRIATNNFLQLRRRRRILSFIPLKEEHESGSARAVEDPSGTIEAQMDIQQALSKIPPEQRVCMVLHFVEELKYREIAAVLKISEEAVRKRVARGSREFRKLYISEEAE
ncbi:MAG: RNA polymerase sigma factor [Dehalococcoidales bacterium]|nr:RNA polymerase sigma factor [Dehalococcoidales bacterium]